MKVPMGIKVTRLYEKDGKVYYCFKLKWWYAIWTAIASCFSARWFVEHSTEEDFSDDKGKNGGKE